MTLIRKTKQLFSAARVLVQAIDKETEDYFAQRPFLSFQGENFSVMTDEDRLENQIRKEYAIVKIEKICKA